MKQITTLLLLILFGATQAWGGSVKGIVTDSETGDPLVGANIVVMGTTMGTTTDEDGFFLLQNIPDGDYSLGFSYVGYKDHVENISLSGSANLEIALTPTVYRGKEVIVEVNRARERETPVAFTNVSSQEIDQVINGQDAPLLIEGTPGVYAYSTDGVGNGEAQLHIRGFDQNYVQVLINGVPTNDPESNAVYWSNWGSVSSAAQSIQVQRGAGSSLYGAGSFGGSFNIVTQDASPTRYLGVDGALGDPNNTIYGVEINTGLLSNKFAFSTRVDRKVGEGRIGGIYKGVNYYLSGAWYMNEKQSLKLVLHGAPQEHSYSWSAGVSFFKKYGFEANPSPILARSAVEKLPDTTRSGKMLPSPHWELLDGSREVMNDSIVSLAHNHFHKPQLELHYSYDVNENSTLRATFFYSKGSGGGSSLNGQSDFEIGALRNEHGIIDDVDYIINDYLANAYQRDSFSLHRQLGLLTNFDTKIGDNVNLTVGGEFRSWQANHPGFYTNLYGKDSVNAIRYAYFVNDTTISRFTRTTFEGDMDHKSDTGNPLNWDIDKAIAADPTYRTQYRNYKGTTPQLTIFGQANVQLTPQLNALGTLQYVWYNYKLQERMPSENAIGVPVAAGTVTKEGPDGNGNFYMRDAFNSSQYYRFELVDESRSRGFIQPKVGLNYNASQNLNLFGSFAHVERFVDLGVYYNRGLINPDAEDEKSSQFELGFGWRTNNINAKVNAYRITWDNKSNYLIDPSKAGQPGYDRNGGRTELIGQSTHKGIEVAMNANVYNIIPIRGLTFRSSLTLMDNKWTDILDEVRLVSPISRTGRFEDKNLNGLLDPGEDTNGNGVLDEDRRIYNSGSSVLDYEGNRDAVYFDELKDTHVSGQPQTAVMMGLEYHHRSGFFGTFTMFYYDRDYTVDGGSYRPVDGYWISPVDFIITEYSDQNPSRTTFDAAAGYRFDFYNMKMNLTGQIVNLFDKDYFASADAYGFIPGPKRTFRVNLSVGY
jgi:outer membrane receptor protein involved in Fe transport